MFGVGLSEIVIIFIVALLLFGPEELPKISRMLGRTLGEFNKRTESVRREWYKAIHSPLDEVKRDFETEKRALRAVKDHFTVEARTINTEVKKALDVSKEDVKQG